MASFDAPGDVSRDSSRDAPRNTSRAGPASPQPDPDTEPDLQEIRQTLREQARTEGRAQGLAEGREQGFAEGLEQGRQEGQAAGHEAGYADGLAQGIEQGIAQGLEQGREQGRAEAARLNALASSLADALRGIEEQIGQGLITLALDIAAHVVRERLNTQPEAMLAAVREVLHLNPAAPQGTLRLWIHPDDLELVRLHLADELKAGHWRVLADESIARGGCRAESPYGDIDATLPTRWRRVSAALGRDAPPEAQP